MKAIALAVILTGIVILNFGAAHAVNFQMFGLYVGMPKVKACERFQEVLGVSFRDLKPGESTYDAQMAKMFDVKFSGICAQQYDTSFVGFGENGKAVIIFLDSADVIKVFKSFKMSNKQFAQAFEKGSGLQGFKEVTMTNTMAGKNRGYEGRQYEGEEFTLFIRTSLLKEVYLYKPS